MATTETLLARFEADIIDFSKKMQQMRQQSSAAADAVKSHHMKAANDTARAWKSSGFDQAMKQNVGAAKSLRDTLVQLAPAMAAAFSVKEALAMADTWKQFTNQLKVAGLQGADLAKVQDQLAESANRNNVALGPMATLYNRVAGSAKTLGASQQDLVKFTDGVATAIKVSGQSMEASSGALLQLGQMMGGSMVQAQEYNSLLDGARPVLEAVAAGSDKYAGSVDKLTKAVKSGKVSVSEFYADFQRGQIILKDKVESTETTVEGAFQTMQNKLAEYIGKADASYGITNQLANGIIAFANNLDEVAAVLAALTGVLGGAYVAAAGRSIAVTVAKVAADRALTTSAAAAAVATEGLAAALNMLGGPWGIAIMAVAGALAYLVTKEEQAKKKNEELVKSVLDEEEARDKARLAAKSHGDETVKWSDKQLTAIKNTLALTGETKLLADAHWQVVAAIKAEEQATLDKNAREARSKADQLRDARVSSESKLNRPKQTYRGSGTSRDWDAATIPAAPGSTEWKRDETVRKAEYLANNFANEEEAKAKKNRQTKVTDYKLPEEYNPGKGDDKKKKGRSAADIKRSDDHALASATQEELSLRISNTKTEEDRHKLALELLQLEHDNKVTAIKEDKNTSDAAKTRLLSVEDAAFAARKDAENATNLANIGKKAQEEGEKKLAQMKADNEYANQLAQYDEDLLNWKAQNATNTADRARYERQALEARQRRELKEIDADTDLALAKFELTGNLEDLAEAYALQAKREHVAATQVKPRPEPTTNSEKFAEWVRKQGGTADNPVQSIDDQLNQIADNGLQNFTDGITDAILGAKSLGQAFSETAKQIVADLVRIAVKFLVLETIGEAFGIKGLGKAAIGISGGHAAGTDYSRGGLFEVGEKGKELVMLPGGSQVLPNNLLRNIGKDVGGTSSNSNKTTVNNYYTVNANNSLVNSELQEMMLALSVQGGQAGRQGAQADIYKKGRNTF